ncbi:MAG: hypothetical protein ACMUIL_00260 [bacterium]
MDRTYYPVKGLCFILVTMLLIAIITIAQNTTENGHDFMNDPNRCGDCHLGEPVFGETDYRDLEFTDDIVALCQREECHPAETLGRSHPVNITPPDDMDVPEDLHLDEYLNMTCATCHQPHGEAYTVLKPADYVLPVGGSSQSIYPSFYLRRTNIQNALCFACHKR